jgi:hypothetical protein
VGIIHHRNYFSTDEKPQLFLNFDSTECLPLIVGTASVAGRDNASGESGDSGSKLIQI